MMRAATLFVAALFAAGCSQEETATPPPAPATQSDAAATTTVDAAEAFASLLDEHFERSLELSPLGATSIGDDRYNDRYANSIGPEHRAAQRALNDEALERLATIDRSALSAADQLSYDIFRLLREKPTCR